MNSLINQAVFSGACWKAGTQQRSVFIWPAWERKFWGKIKTKLAQSRKYEQLEGFAWCKGRTRLRFGRYERLFAFTSVTRVRIRVHSTPYSERSTWFWISAVYSGPLQEVVLVLKLAEPKNMKKKVITATCFFTRSHPLGCTRSQTSFLKNRTFVQNSLCFISCLI